MKRTFIYPQTIQRVREACRKVLDDSKAANVLQSVIQQAEQEIVAVEEKTVRDQMTDMEGRLELIGFTVADDHKEDANKDAASDLLSWLEYWESGSA